MMKFVYSFVVEEKEDFWAIWYIDRIYQRWRNQKIVTKLKQSV